VGQDWEIAGREGRFTPAQVAAISTPTVSFKTNNSQSSKGASSLWLENGPS